MQQTEPQVPKLPSILTGIGRIVLPLSIAAGLLGVGFSYWLLQKNAEQEVESRARVLFDTLQSVQDYVRDDLKPKLDTALAGQFIPQAHETFVARGISSRMQAGAAFRFKEATLNPLNLADKADKFETKLVEAFRKAPTLTEITTYRETADGRFFVLAKPLKAEATCLQCHGQASAAPAAIQQFYGTTHGYGWKPGEVISAFVVQVPTLEPFNRARQTAFAFALLVFTLLAALLSVGSVLLKKWVSVPIDTLTESIELIAKGQLDKDLSQPAASEMASLALAVERLRLSLISAMKLLQRARGGP